MVDLTTITTPFGLLDAETQQALREWEGEIERYIGNKWVISNKNYGVFTLYYTYRAKPIPLTKPSINWDHVAPEWRWLAKDQNESVWLFQSKPYIGEYAWSSKVGENYIKTYMFSSLLPGTCDWKDSLVERPTKEDNTTEDLL